MPKGRSPLEIRIKILENSMENIKPSPLMSATNLNWGRMNEEINGLKMRGLIEEIEIGKEERKKDRRTKINYRTTMKGVNIVKMFNEVKKVLV